MVFPMVGLFGLMLLILPVAVALIVVFALWPQPPAGANREAALDILARRFASGEISAEEYQKARDLLQGGSKPPAI